DFHVTGVQTCALPIYPPTYSRRGQRDRSVVHTGPMSDLSAVFADRQTDFTADLATLMPGIAFSSPSNDGLGRTEKLSSASSVSCLPPTSLSCTGVSPLCTSRVRLSSVTTAASSLSAAACSTN